METEIQHGGAFCQGHVASKWGNQEAIFKCKQMLKSLPLHRPWPQNKLREGWHRWILKSGLCRESVPPAWSWCLRETALPATSLSPEPPSQFHCSLGCMGWSLSGPTHSILLPVELITAVFPPAYWVFNLRLDFGVRVRDQPSYSCLVTR